VILRDPHSETGVAGMAATLKLQQRIAGDVHQVADMVNLLEQMRARLEQLEHRHADDPPTLREVRAMDQAMQGVEYELFSRHLAPSDDKYFVSAYKVYYNLLWLNAEIGTGAGDVAGSADFGPTDTAPMLLSMIEKNLRRGAGDYQALMMRVPAFNAALRKQGITPLDTTLRPLPDLKKAYPEDMHEAGAD
jgi:hypothetical protein